MSHYDDQEMSMEEILASIRRYVSDEGPIDPLPPPSPKPIKLRPDQVVRDGSVPLHPQTHSSHSYLPADSSFPAPNSVYPHEYVKDEPLDHRGLSLQESRAPEFVPPSVPPQREDVNKPLPSGQHFPVNNKDPHPSTKIETIQNEFPAQIPVAPQNVTPDHAHEKVVQDPPSFLAPQAFEASLHAFSKLTESLEKAQISNSSDPENTNVTLIHFLKALMAPQIKAWLDQNLPTLVEEIVRQEVEKITSHLKKNF